MNEFIDSFVHIFSNPLYLVIGVFLFIGVLLLLDIN